MSWRAAGGHPLRGAFQYALSLLTSLAMPDCLPASAQPPDMPEMPEWHAPAHWQAVDVIADLHLNQSEPATAAAWWCYMLGTPASAVIILGDLFEAWIGDDAAGVAPDDAQPAPTFDFGPD